MPGSTTRDEGGGPDDATVADDPLVTDDVHINWHHDEVDGQVILGTETGRVRIAVAFPVDVAQAELESVLDERDRELDHFFDRLGHGPE